MPFSNFIESPDSGSGLEFFCRRTVGVAKSVLARGHVLEFWMDSLMVPLTGILLQYRNHHTGYSRKGRQMKRAILAGVLFVASVASGCTTPQPAANQSAANTAAKPAK